MNKLRAILILLSCFGLFLIPSCQVFQNSELTITKLEDNMWVIETSDNCTMYLVEGTQRALLIDTGTKIKNLDTVVSSITRKPLDVVITHAHGDHAGNIDSLKRYGCTLPTLSCYQAGTKERSIL